MPSKERVRRLSGGATEETMSLRHIGTLSFKNWRGEASMFVSIDLEQLVAYLGDRALSNKSKKATLCGCSIVIEAAKYPHPCLEAKP
jgi:hypothetical protein